MSIRFPRGIFILVIASILSGIATLPALAKLTAPAPTQETVYWQLVDSSRELILQLNGLPTEKISQSLDDLANKWEAIKEVELDGKVIPIDNGYLVGLLRAEAPDLKQIDGILKALQEAHQKYPSQVFSGSELTSLHTILARPEFTWANQAPNPLNDLIQRLLEALGRLWDRILGDEPIRVSVNPTTLSVIASIILVALLVFVFRSLFKDFVKEAQLNDGEGAENEPLTSDAAFQKAQMLSQGGDFRSAVRYLYLSSLLLMDERGVMRYDRSKTNREYLRSVSSNPELSKPLGDVIEVFDNVWYGYHSLEEKTFRHYSDRVEELKRKKP